jgi:carotenoid 1,2-hydratase
LNRITVPERPGAYRWYYVDATAGDFTAVCIFMIGSLFSPRYAVTHRRGAAPRAHAAVNFALYQRGSRRAWVLSEYSDLAADERALRIGRSTLRYSGERGLEVELDERLAPCGGRFRARLELESHAPPLAPLTLVEGKSHQWHPIAPRSTAKLSVPQLGLEVARAHAYHDGNHGDVLLGTDLPGWDWRRTYDPQRTVIDYRPWGSEQGWRVIVQPSLSIVGQSPVKDLERRKTRWGLKIPTPKQGAKLLESSPFYARLEATTAATHELGEVADFARFRKPWIRWMAHLRTRVERAA